MFDRESIQMFFLHNQLGPDIPGGFISASIFFTKVGSFAMGGGGGGGGGGGMPPQIRSMISALTGQREEKRLGKLMSLSCRGLRLLCWNQAHSAVQNKIVCDGWMEDSGLVTDVDGC